MEAMMASEIQVYGTDWCGLTRPLREYLTHSRLPFDYFDIDRNADARRFVQAISDSPWRFPLVVVEGHRIVMVPTVSTLQQVLTEHGFRPMAATVALPDTRW
jgi:glutaredoxin